MSVVGLLLAAGAGRRLGGPKALVEVGGTPLLHRAVRLLRDGGCAEVVVVVGAQADAVAALAEAEGCRTVRAEGWSEGMGASLRAGLAALADGPHDACVVALVDQPLLGPAAVARLIGTGGPAAVATYGGAARNPVLLDRSVWSEVAASAADDAGARDWLRAHPELVHAVPCDDTGSPRDVDVPADLVWAREVLPDPGAAGSSGSSASSASSASTASSASSASRGPGRAAARPDVLPPDGLPPEPALPDPLLPDPVAPVPRPPGRPTPDPLRPTPHPEESA